MIYFKITLEITIIQRFGLIWNDSKLRMLKYIELLKIIILWYDAIGATTCAQKRLHETYTCIESSSV